MLHIKVETKRREGRNKFREIDMAAYAKKMFNMFDGEEQNVEILCDNSLAGVMIDRFGKDVRILKVDDEHFRVLVKVAASKHFIHWIMALGEGAKIIGPESLVKEVQDEIKRLAEHYGFNYLDSDYLILHQANMKMNKMIAKKLKFEPERVPTCMYGFGNTSSASIPLTIVTQLKGKCEEGKKFLCCGFGVGLSWGTVAFESKGMVVSELVEVEELNEEQKWV